MPASSRASENDRLPTPGAAITKPQMGDEGNASRKGTPADGPTDGFRHRLIDHARVSTADPDPGLQTGSVLHLVTLGADPGERRIGLHVIEQGVGTSTMEGRAMLGLLSVPADRPPPTEDHRGEALKAAGWSLVP
ncbi:hypothetical protein ACWGR3_27190 [Streptomyces albidoflavus]